MNRPEFNLYIRERQEGMCDILESSDVVMEFFKLKKDKRAFKEENTIESVNEEIREIRNDVLNLLRANLDICRVAGNRLMLNSSSATINSVKKEDKNRKHYYSGAEFTIVFTNQQEVKPGDDLKQYKAALRELERKMDDLLEEKHPRFKANIYDLHLPEIKLLLK